MFKPFLSVFFKLVSTIKVNFGGIKRRELFIQVLFNMSSTKIYHFRPFFTWFLNLGKTQDSSQDADQVCWRHRLSAAPPHIKFTSFCRESQRLCTDGKIVKNSRGRFHQLPPPPCITEGVWLCVYVRGISKPRYGYYLVQPSRVMIPVGSYEKPFSEIC